MNYFENPPCPLFFQRGNFGGLRCSRRRGIPVPPALLVPWYKIGFLFEALMNVALEGKEWIAAHALKR